MKYRAGSFLAYWFLRGLSRTLRKRIIGAEKCQQIQDSGRGVVLVGWHGRSLIAMAEFRGRGYWSMISTSRDGEWQNHIFRRLGFNTVRGSSSARGAVQSTLNIVKQLKKGAVLAHTPDGPRGPSRTFHLGAVFMAQRSGCDIIPVGISAAPRRLLPTWDSYMVPAPFARTAMVYGEPLCVPKDFGEEDLQRLATFLGCEIDRLEEEADRLVGLPMNPMAAERASVE